MDFMVERADVWAAAIEDKPGSLAELLDALRSAGADLQFIIARRAPEKPGTGVVFVTPLQSDREIRLAAQVGRGLLRPHQIFATGSFQCESEGCFRHARTSAKGRAGLASR